MQKLKNNEPGPKFTESYIKKQKRVAKTKAMHFSLKRLFCLAECRNGFRFPSCHRVDL